MKFASIHVLCVAALLAAAGCTPTVRVETPREPITINLNVKIEHEVRVQIEKQLEDTIFNEESGLF